MECPRKPSRKLISSVALTFCLCGMGAPVLANDACSAGKTLLARALIGRLLSGQGIAGALDGKSRLYYAAALGFHKRLKDLLYESNGKHIDSDVLLVVAEAGDLVSMRALLEANADVNARNKQGVTPLIMAAQCNDIDMMSLLIRSGADVNARTNDGIDAMLEAIVDGNIAEVKLLIKNGFDLKKSRTSTGVTPVEAAQRAHHEKIVHLLKQADS